MAARHGRRAPASGLSSTQSLAARHRRGAPCAGQRDLSGLSSTPSMTARRRRRAPCAGGGRLSSTPSMAARRRRGAPCANERAQLDRRRLRRDISAERREPASGLSSTPSIAARRRRGACAGGGVGWVNSTLSIAARHRRRAPCAGERAQLDVVDCGATSVWSAASRRAGTCLTPSIAARRRRRAPCAGGGEAQLDAVDCGATSARSAVRQRAGSARRRRWRHDVGAERREPASGLSSTPWMAARRRRGACAGGGHVCGSTRRRRLRRDVGAERRAPASGLSSTLSMVARQARRRRGAPFAGERAQLDAVDCGATTVRSAPSRRAGACLTPSMAARHQRGAP